MHNIFAHTEPTPPEGYPAYVSINRDATGKHTITVRSRGNGGRDPDEEQLLTGGQAEAMAALDPEHDWQIVLEGPLSGRTYQRHGPDNWVLIEQNMGFA